MRRVKAQDDLVQEALAKRNTDEIHINDVKTAAELIRQDLRKACNKVEVDIAKENSPSKSNQEIITQNIEDMLDVEEMRERMKQIDACEPLKKSWIRESLVLNL